MPSRRGLGAGESSRCALRRRRDVHHHRRDDGLLGSSRMGGVPSATVVTCIMTIIGMGFWAAAEGEQLKIRWFRGSSSRRFSGQQSMR